MSPMKVGESVTLQVIRLEEEYWIVVGHRTELYKGVKNWRQMSKALKSILEGEE